MDAPLAFSEVIQISSDTLTVSRFGWLDQDRSNVRSGTLQNGGSRVGSHDTLLASCAPVS